MKYLKLFEDFKSSFSYQDVVDKQSQGYMSSDIFFGGNKNDFQLKEVDLKDITINGKKSRVSLSFYDRHDLDEDVSIVNKLLRMYRNGDNVHPIVLTKDLDIMDGVHRYVALKELKKKNIKAFVQA